MESRLVLLGELTRKEIREGMEEGHFQTAIIPAGSCEQHNEHLAMSHDTASAEYISELAAIEMYPDVIVTPGIAVGISEEITGSVGTSGGWWMKHKGTLTLRKSVFVEVLYDICDSLRRHGVSNILIVNGHWPNAFAIDEKIEEFREKLGVNLEVVSYWDAYTKEDVEKYMESGRCPDHASEFETSFAMAAFPERVHLEDVDYEGARLPELNAVEAERDRRGAMEAKLASAEKGRAMIDVSVKWVVERIEEMMKA